MESKEQKIQTRIAALESEIAALSAEIEEKRAEQKRFRDALDVWLSLDSDLQQTQHKSNSTREFRSFDGRRFLDCVTEILEKRGPQGTKAIHDVLLAGGFKSESANFKSIVSNMLNEAAKNTRLVKTGDRFGAVWSLPPKFRAASMLHFNSTE